MYDSLGIDLLIKCTIVVTKKTCYKKMLKYIHLVVIKTFIQLISYTQGTTKIYVFSLQ